MEEGRGSGRSKDLVALCAIVLASIWGTWLFIRGELNLGSGWTDGEQQYASVRGERIRYAVWDTPEELLGGINGLDAESQPAISPDGHWMVFSVGERGLNSDLFVGELMGGEVRDVRPLNMLNTGFDELAPAFGPDALYFASDRGGAAFGLDLWRAPYADGVFSPAESIGSGINSPSDETDPCPLPGTRQLLFSSNRPRASRTDFDLYVARPAEPTESAPEEIQGAAKQTPERQFEVLEVAGLNTPFDERDPTLTSDGRTLIFASDRDGSLGGFDLYRSFKEADKWLPAESLVGVNSYRSERGPLLSADGFSLYFDVSDGEELADLWRAHSKELFRVPAAPLSIYEILGLLALLILAILAWLSKRWRTMDVIYRCFLISLLIHLFLMWYLREVYPENGPVETGGTERLFRVRLAPSSGGMPSASIERNGQLELSAQVAEPEASEPSRAESTAALANAEPAEVQVARPERQLQEPSRRAAKLTENRAKSALAANMQDAEAPTERYSESAPLMRVQTQDTGSERSEVASSTPDRENSSAAAEGATRPLPASSTGTLVAQRNPAELGQQTPQAQRIVRQQESGALRGTQVASPQEAFTAASSDAPDMAMPDLTLAAAPERRSGAAERREVQSHSSPLQQGMALPRTGALSLQAPERESEEFSGAARKRSFEEPTERLSSENSKLALRAMDASESGSPSAQPSPSFDASSSLAQAQSQPNRAESSDPNRLHQDLSQTTRPTTSSQSFAALELEAPQAEQPRALPLESSLSPSQSHQVVSMRDIEESLAPLSKSELQPRSFDATAGLAPSEPKRFERKGPSAPAAVPFKTERLTAAASPSAKPMEAAFQPEELARDDLPKRLEQTPYQNRFGEKKLRALDEFGGGVETEQAVADGLAYLASIQNRDGSWGQASDFDRGKYRDVRVGKSALALLAFLGAGHTPESNKEHSQVTQSCIQYLSGIQDAATGHFGNSSSYGHGIATYALAECFAITQDASLRPAIELGIARILAKQDRRRDRRSRGGWGYYFRDDSVWDNDRWPRVSVTSWQVMALESARIGGLEVPAEALHAAEEFLAGAWDGRRQAFRYSHDPARLNSGYPILPASTPAALFALSLLGNDISSSELAPARRFVLQRAPFDYRYNGADDFVENGRGNLYFWYYSTLAMFRVGGSEWARWNAAMKSTLLESQSPNGSWKPLSTYSEYAGDDRDERTYSTAMCVLSLEVYYRYFTPLLNR